MIARAMRSAQPGTSSLARNRWAIVAGALVLMAAGPAAAQKAMDSTGRGAPAVALDACTSYPIGQPSYACRCDPDSGSSGVWGSGPYTADSDICLAARHAGVIGEAGGAVQVLAAPGEPSYAGSRRNGVQTQDWGGYDHSFMFAGVARQDVAPPASARVVEVQCAQMPGDAERFTCTCAPGTPVATNVWGSGPYTSDSDLCSAARHAGVIGPAGGPLRVLRIPGLEEYAASTSNGVASAAWGSYDSSIVFDRNR